MQERFAAHEGGTLPFKVGKRQQIIWEGHVDLLVFQGKFPLGIFDN